MSKLMCGQDRRVFLRGGEAPGKQPGSLSVSRRLSVPGTVKQDAVPIASPPEEQRGGCACQQPRAGCFWEGSDTDPVSSVWEAGWGTLLP